MSKSQQVQVQFTAEQAIEAYLSAHHGIKNALEAFDAVVTPEWVGLVSSLSNDEADFLLGLTGGAGEAVVLFAKASQLPTKGASLWALDTAIETAFVKNDVKTREVINTYLKLTAEGNFAKFANRDVLIAKLSLVGKKESVKTDESVLSTRRMNSFVKGVRNGAYDTAQLTEVLNAIQAVITSK